MHEMNLEKLSENQTLYEQKELKLQKENEIK